MMLENETAWRETPRQILRIVRGKGSQVAVSRRLGCRSDVSADWEGGHRAPTATALLRAMRRVGIDVEAGFEEFQPSSASALHGGVSAWLDALKGSTRQADVAQRTGASRHQIRRWLSGEAEPRVPKFLALVPALTGRAHDWVAGGPRGGHRGPAGLRARRSPIAGGIVSTRSRPSPPTPRPPSRTSVDWRPMGLVSPSTGCRLRGTRTSSA